MEVSRMTDASEGLLELHERAGGVLFQLHGVRVPRHYGDSGAEYAAAIQGAAVVDRSHRALLCLSGRSPARMLTGIVSGSMPPEPFDAGDGARKGRTEYSTILTPKGKLITDLRLFRLEAGEAGAHLLDLPRAGLDGLLEHLKRYLPPRFARIQELDSPPGLLTVVGPDAVRVLDRQIPGFSTSPGEVESWGEGDEVVLDAEGPVGIRIVRNQDVQPLALDVVAPLPILRTLWKGLVESGVLPAGHGVWETLRIEKGRPEFGQELDRDTLPPEAGIHRRAIDHQKGCYTGQEVIVRIRDRGRVNRHLRGFLLGEQPNPSIGTPLFIEGRDRAAGEIRSVVQSPRFGQTIGMGYLRREAEPPTIAHLGAVDGPTVAVRALTDEGWELVERDPGRSDL
jgi:tRNA-modifying protein YgfZ